MGRTFDKSIWIAIGLVVTLLLFSAALAYRNIDKLNDDAAVVAHTHEVLDLISDVLLTIIDAETGERGYIITSKEEYLHPYHAAVARLDEEMAALKDKTKVDSHQHEHIKKLEEMTSERMAMLKANIDLRQGGVKQPGVFIRAATKGKEQTDSIRKLIATMERDEHLLLKERQQETNDAYRVSVATVLGTGLVGLFMVGAFVWLLHGSMRNRQKTAEVIREQREWFRTTLASIGDAVITTDTKGRVTFLNTVAQALTGWTQEESQGMALEQVFRIVNEESRRSVENPVLRSLRDGQIVGLANHTLLIAKDGTERPIDDSAAPIRNHEGNLSGVVLVFRDVTERRRAEQRAAAQYGIALILAEARTLEAAVPRILETI